MYSVYRRALIPVLPLPIVATDTLPNRSSESAAMSTDREVLRVVWEGQIPVCFQVDASEVAGVQQPENFYLMISRLSYLPLVTEKVNRSSSV